MLKEIVILPKNMSTIGHRGAAGYEIENTANSIETAISMGVDMIELDVRRCASGELIIFHDATVKRLTGKKGSIKKMRMEAIKKLSTFDGQKILTLQEALNVIKGRCWVNLDIKSKGVAKDLMKIIHECVIKEEWKLRQFLISSFNHAELKRIKTIENKIKIGLLYYRNILTAKKRAKKLLAYSVHLNALHIKKSLVDFLHRNGVKTFVWTVNNPLEAKRLYQMGVDGVISDYPDIV